MHCWHGSVGCSGFFAREEWPWIFKDKRSSFIIIYDTAEHLRISQAALTEQWERVTGMSHEIRQPCKSRTGQNEYDIPFIGILWLLAPTSWYCHHKCPAAFSLHLSNTAETKPGWGAITAALFTLPVYLSGAGLELPQVGKLRYGCAYWEGVCIAPKHMHTPVQEDGCGQQRVMHLLICSKLLKVEAKRICMVLLHCTPSAVKLCLAAAFSRKAGLWRLASIAPLISCSS